MFWIEYTGLEQQQRMGNELCNGAPEEEFEQIDYNPDEDHIDEEINKIIRKGEPSEFVAFNINDLPEYLKESDRLTKFQEKITRLMAHEKRHNKPLVLTKNANPKNKLPNPYYIRSLDAIYIGEWVLDKDVNQVVPGGLGRLYSNERIIQGEILSKAQGGFGFFDQGVNDFNITQQMVQHNKEKANFFSIPTASATRKKQTPIRITELAEDQYLKIDIVLNGEGRSFTRTTEERGIFKDGLLFGKGYCRIKDGEDVYEYTGEFKEGKKNGKGIEKFKLTNYDGDFENDEKHGKGTLTLFISRAYDQERLEEETKIALQDKESDPSQKVGKAKDYIKERNAYELRLNEALKKEHKWVPPKYPAKSMLQNQNFIIDHHRRIKFLEQYKGDFEHNNFHGHGTYTWFNGKCYNGSWKNGQMDGIGQFYWPKGILYRGQYEKDMRHGKGEMIWSLEKRFRGSWAYGLRHGYGQLIEIETQPGLSDKNLKIYFLRVKGALFDKDKLIKEYFNTRQQVDDLRLHELKIKEKEMVAFVKDLKIDLNKAS